MKVGVIFNKNDYTILSVLVEEQCFSEIASLSIKQISANTKLSIPKIRLVLKSFLLMDLIREGAKDGISKTFYCTDKGKQFLLSAMNPNYNEDSSEEE
jgi:DNA-binding transcriptional regulator GbsR (MarR family)